MSDLISREDAMLKVAKVDKSKYSNIYDFHDACVDALKDLPSVQKTGRWIEKEHPNWGTWGISYLVCSECNGKMASATKFCPHCGADMRNEEISE